MQRRILILVTLAGLFGCSSSSPGKTASDSTTTGRVTRSTATSARSARADLKTAIAQWQASCDTAQCARTTPDGLAQALADRARAFAAVASGDMQLRAGEIAAAAEQVVQLHGCVYSVDLNCVRAVQAVSFALERLRDEEAEQRRDHTSTTAHAAGSLAAGQALTS
jgi:hypothetical protein